MTIADIDRLAVGDSASCDVTFDDAAIQAFARLSFDVNPLHMDAGVAAELGFPARVAHGMLAMSAISRLIGTELPGGGSLWVSHDIQFAQPVFVDNQVTARVTVDQVSKAAGMVLLKVEVVNRTTGTGVLRGSARVRIPARRPATVPRGPAVEPHGD